MPTSPLGRTIHFLCGTLIGLVPGIGIYWALAPAPHAWLAIPIAALLTGTLAARFGDDFWEHGIKYLIWW